MQTVFELQAGNPEVWEFIITIPNDVHVESRMRVLRSAIHKFILIQTITHLYAVSQPGASLAFHFHTICSILPSVTF